MQVQPVYHSCRVQDIKMNVPFFNLRSNYRDGYKINFMRYSLRGFEDFLIWHLSFGEYEAKKNSVQRTVNFIDNFNIFLEEKTCLKQMDWIAAFKYSLIPIRWTKLLLKTDDERLIRKYLRSLKDSCSWLSQRWNIKFSWMTRIFCGTSLQLDKDQTPLPLHQGTPTHQQRMRM